MVLFFFDYQYKTVPAHFIKLGKTNVMETQLTFKYYHPALNIACRMYVMFGY